MSEVGSLENIMRLLSRGDITVLDSLLSLHRRFSLLYLAICLHLTTVHFPHLYEWKLTDFDFMRRNSRFSPSEPLKTHSL